MLVPRRLRLLFAVAGVVVVDGGHTFAQASAQQYLVGVGIGDITG